MDVFSLGGKLIEPRRREEKTFFLRPQRRMYERKEEKR